MHVVHSLDEEIVRPLALGATDKFKIETKDLVLKNTPRLQCS